MTVWAWVKRNPWIWVVVLVILVLGLDAIFMWLAHQQPIEEIPVGP